MKKKTGKTSSKKTAAPISAKTLQGRKIIVETKQGYYSSLGYRSVITASSEGRSYTAASGERHEQYHRPKLITQSRDFMRNNAIYKGMIEKAVSYIIGSGFTLQFRTPDKEFNTAAEKYWNNWHRRPEIRGILSGSKTDRMICRELLVAGDTLIILTKNGTIQLIEAEQLAGRTSVAIDGIQKNEVGRPINYWICPYNRNGIVNTSKAKSYAPENVLFITNPERASSVRGVPPSQSAFSMLHRINDVCDSEAVSWQLLARLAVSITRKQGAEEAYLSSKANPDKEGSAGEGSLATRITELDYALMFHGDVDEEIKGIERNIPGKDFGVSLRMFLRLLGLPLGLPLEIILLDWTKSNYSQSRAVLEQAYEMFLDYQSVIEDYYYRPLVNWKLKEALSTQKLKGPDEFEFDLIKPTFPWIDQLKEAQAYGAKVDRGFTTHSQVCKAQKLEREDVITAREAEVRDAIERAKRIKEETDMDVPWQIFAGLEPPSSATKVNITANKED